MTGYKQHMRQMKYRQKKLKIAGGGGEAQCRSFQRRVQSQPLQCRVPPSTSCSSHLPPSPNSSADWYCNVSWGVNRHTVQWPSGSMVLQVRLVSSRGRIMNQIVSRRTSYFDVSDYRPSKVFEQLSSSDEVGEWKATDDRSQPMNRFFNWRPLLSLKHQHS